MIARKSVLIITLNLLNGLLGYIALFFISRYMSPWDYGVVAFAYGFVSLFSIFGSFGFPHAHTKKISEGKNLGTCIGTFLSIRLTLMGVMTSVVLIAVLVWKVIIGRGFESSTHETAVYIMLGYCVLNIFSNSVIQTFRAKKEIAKAQFPLFFEVIARVIATIFVAVGGYGALALALTYIVGWAANIISSLYFIHGYPINRPQKNYLKEYSAFAFPLIIVDVCSIIMTNIDKVLIQLFWSAEDVGYYFSSFKLSQFINMFTVAIGMLLFPTFSTLHSKRDIKGINKLLLDSTRYLSMIVFPMVFGIVVLAEPTVFILLSGWMPAVPILQILPFFVLFAALERPYQSQFLGMNQPKLARNRVLIMVCSNVILNVLLIPEDIQMIGIKLVGLGARGAAVATVISYALGLFYSRMMSWRLTQIKGNPRIIIHAISAGIMAAILYLMLYRMNLLVIITRWYHLLAFAFIGFGIYIIILIMLREFTKKDFFFFIEILNIKKMLSYIKQEIKK
jgi:O-antigen/teichoic acid export membrane protein